MENQNLARWLALTSLSLPVLATESIAQANQLTLSSEVEYSSGKYGGTESTDILFMPLVAKYETGAAVLKLTIPYVEISSPGNVQIVNAGLASPVTNGPITPATQRGKAVGLGDIVTSVAYNVLYDAPSGLMFDVGGKVKFATASREKGLGTGKHDFGVQADAYQSLGRATTLMATLGYTWMGKPAGSNFRNIAFASTGMAYTLNATTTLSGFLDVRQAVVGSNPSPRELTFYVTRRLDKNWKIQVYALAGISDASPQKGGGVTLGYSM